MNDASLSPFGTAREHFLHGNGNAAPDPLLRLLSLLRTNVQQYTMEEETVQIALEMVQWQKGLSFQETRALLLLIIGSMIMLHQGSTRMPLSEREGVAYLESIIETLLSDGSEELAAPGPVVREIIEESNRILAHRGASNIIGSPDTFKPIIIADGHLYHYRMFHLERRLAEKLRAILASTVSGTSDESLIRSVNEAATRLTNSAGKGRSLSDEQKNAVHMAIKSPFCIITGGPGTGKTSVVVSLLRALISLGFSPESIALAAPTGKAANRMGESIQKDLAPSDAIDRIIQKIAAPKTLHRLLGYTPSQGTFKHHKNNLLAEQVVIIDESSMIDLFLMERLVSSVGEHARLVLIGDADQLPSVDAGAVFRDLAAGRGKIGDYTVRLTKSYRMDEGRPEGKNILSVANAIREENGKALFDPGLNNGISERTVVRDIEFRKVEIFDCLDTGTPRLGSFLERWHELFVRPKNDAGPGKCISRIYHVGEEGFGSEDTAALDALFSHFSRYKILCLTHVYPTGTDAINRFFHAKLFRETSLEAFTEFIPGEPIMMQHNDYDKNLFNGDQGVVLRVEDGSGGPHHFMGVFRLSNNQYVAYHLHALREHIRHAFAITVHKSQGSEYDHVALILPGSLLPILTKEIVYTGISRSKMSATIVGSRDLLNIGISRNVMRFSGIADRMANP